METDAPNGDIAAAIEFRKGREIGSAQAGRYPAALT
jgi:hypothetical protein